MTEDLIVFLRARLDEDEAVARNASDGPWVRHVGYISGGPTGAVRVAQQAQAWNADHIVRHDPARVLREVEAKRRIISDYEASAYTLSVAGPGTPPHDIMTGAVNTLKRMLQYLALPYADHPDYREAWRP